VLSVAKTNKERTVNSFMVSFCDDGGLEPCVSTIQEVGKQESNGNHIGCADARFGTEILTHSCSLHLFASVLRTI
jgi:hypothetical protein